METNNIEGMKKDYWDKNQTEIKAEIRLAYLQTFVRSLPHYCPECDGELETDDCGETICTECNLVCSGPIAYIGLEHIDYPYGIRL